MRRFARSFRDTVRQSKAGNDLYADLAGKPRLDYSAYNLDRPKRAPSVPKANNVPKANTPSEHQSQSAVISWWSLACTKHGLPRHALAAVPNGGARDAITGARLKAEGVRAGFPDLILMAKRGEYGALVIEMKKDGNYPSAAQREIIAYLKGAGYACEICWSSEAAIKVITDYLNRRSHVDAAAPHPRRVESSPSQATGEYSSDAGADEEL